MTPRHLRTRRRRRGFFFCCCGPSITVPCSPCAIPKQDLSYALATYSTLTGVVGAWGSTFTLTYAPGGGPSGIDVWRGPTTTGSFFGDVLTCSRLNLACLGGTITWITDRYARSGGVCGSCAPAVTDMDFAGDSAATTLKLCSQTWSTTYQWFDYFHDCGAFEVRWKSPTTRFSGTTTGAALKVWL